MKKLLSLLSVLTISGTAVPTTIAASSYKKEESIKNININYQQTNNLENLKRTKRENINFNNYFVKRIEKTNNYDTFYLTFKKDNELYIGTVDNGALILNLNNNEIKNIEGIPNTVVWSITFSKTNNDTYFATGQGVYLLKSNENTAKKIDGTEGDVRWTAIDSNNISYFSIWQKGLFKWENNILTKYNNISGYVNALEIDNEDNLYVGFWNSGEKMLVLKKNTSEFIPIEIPAQNIGFIWFNNKDNSIYIGGTNKIYILKDLKINKIIDCTGWVMSIAVSLDNNEIFFTTHNDGSFVFDKKQNKIEKIEKIITEHSRSVTIDKYNNVYFATSYEKKGVYILKNINYLENNFKKDLNEKQNEIDDLKKQLNNKQNEIDSLTTDKIKLETDFKKSNLEIKNLESEKEELIIKNNTEINQLKKDLIEKQDHELKQLNSQIADLNKSKTELKNKLEKINLEQNKLHKDLINYDVEIKKIKEKEADLKKIENENIKLEKQIKNIKKQIESSKEQEVIILFKEMLNIKINEKEKNDESIKEKEADLKKINLEIKEIEKSFKNTQSVIETNKTTITKLKNEIYKLIKKINDLEIAREQVIKITGEIKNLTSEEIYKKLKEAYEKGVYILNTEIIDNLFTICPR